MRGCYVLVGLLGETYKYTVSLVNWLKSPKTAFTKVPFNRDVAFNRDDMVDLSWSGLFYRGHQWVNLVAFGDPQVATLSPVQGPGCRVLDSLVIMHCIKTIYLS